MNFQTTKLMMKNQSSKEFKPIKRKENKNYG